MLMTKVEIGRAQIKSIVGRHVSWAYITPDGGDPTGNCITHCPGCDKNWSITAFLCYVEELEARVGADATLLAADEPEIGGSPC